MDVVGIGTNSLDLVYVLTEYPQPGGPTSKLPVKSHRVSPGGQTATVLCTCTALGLRSSYVGAFGNDDHGRMMRKELAERGVSTEHAPTRDAPNRHAVIVVDERHGDRVVLWERDERLAMRRDELPASLIAAARLVHVDNEDEGIAIDAAQLAREAGVPVTSDIDRVTTQTPALLDAVTVPIFAEHVPEALSGERDLERALRALRAPHHTLLCVTVGARGAMLLDGDRLEHVPGFATDAVDTTGAGDVFRGALFALRMPALRCRAPGTVRLAACQRSRKSTSG
jgi:sulfofructose kinase